MTNVERDAVVIVGAGQAGVTMALSLRDADYTGDIVLIGAESGAPYQRPSLSKGYLAGLENDDDLILRAPEALTRDGIRYRAGVSVVAIDRGSRTLLLGSGETIRYGKLVLATGARPRRLPVPGMDLAGVGVLRSREDSLSLRSRLEGAEHLVVVGGGFLGLEAAATAKKAGLRVTVLEYETRLLHRAIGATVAAALAEVHRGHGVELRLGSAVEEFVGQGSLRGARLSDGSQLPAELALVAVGASPVVELAERAGLTVADGIVVDARLCTSDPDIFAIGDCGRFPSSYVDSNVRLESVQNATDQARFVARRLMDDASAIAYDSVPWFWSQQYDRRLQIAGLALPGDQERVLPASRLGSLAVVRVRDDRIVAVETINHPKVHMQARRLLAAGPVDAARVGELGATVERFGTVSAAVA
jgi:3-phenylpropionate/trans-cinnamate dioxygenase ferredoxin reductase subunit